MTGDYLAAAAGWLTEQPHNHHQLAELVRALAGASPRERQAQLGPIQAAVEYLDLAGLCVVYHHGATSAVAVRHRGALQRVANGEPLAAVARDVEPSRPLTIIRVQPSEFAAWYRTPLRLPVGATNLGIGGVLGATPNEAYAELRDGVTRQIDVPPDQTQTRR